MWFVVSGCSLRLGCPLLLSTHGLPKIQSKSKQRGTQPFTLLRTSSLVQTAEVMSLQDRCSRTMRCGSTPGEPHASLGLPTHPTFSATNARLWLRYPRTRCNGRISLQSSDNVILFLCLCQGQSFRPVRPPPARNVRVIDAILVCVGTAFDLFVAKFFLGMAPNLL